MCRLCQNAQAAGQQGNDDLDTGETYSRAHGRKCDYGLFAMCVFCSWHPVLMAPPSGFFCTPYIVCNASREGKDVASGRARKLPCLLLVSIWQRQKISSIMRYALKRM